MIPVTIVIGSSILQTSATRPIFAVAVDERHTHQLGLAGRRTGGKKRPTTVPDEGAAAHPDRVERRFVASAPNRLWIADITYVATWSGFVYSSVSGR